MSNSRRWREFITWWKSNRLELKDIVYSSPVVRAIDDKIEEIQKNNKEPK